MAPRFTLHDDGSFRSPRNCTPRAEPSASVLAVGAASPTSVLWAAAAEPKAEVAEAAPAVGIPPTSSNKYGKAAAGGGRYGNLKKAGGPSEGLTGLKAHVAPKSANFAVQKRESEFEQEDTDVPQSARAAVGSWSASGGTREASFKKRPPSSGTLSESQSAMGFAVVLQAADGARPLSLASLQ